MVWNKNPINKSRQEPFLKFLRYFIILRNTLLFSINPPRFFSRFVIYVTWDILSPTFFLQLCFALCCLLKLKDKTGNHGEDGMHFSAKRLHFTSTWRSAEKHKSCSIRRLSIFSKNVSRKECTGHSKNQVSTFYCQDNHVQQPRLSI